MKKSDVRFPQQRLWRLGRVSGPRCKGEGVWGAGGGYSSGAFGQNVVAHGDNKKSRFDWELNKES